ncbi:MAG TPA: hypothetical protein VFN94_08930, partial [Nitrospiria bacterium]|nr:hypothetical protein [Nitrospiria bacterium]
PTPSFVPDASGTYELGLIVHDGTVPSPEDRGFAFITPPLRVDVHPETVNLKSHGGSKSLTAELASRVVSSFAPLTATDGVTVTATFALTIEYLDASGQPVVFTLSNEDYPGDDRVEAEDRDRCGRVDEYALTLKFARSAFIAGFTDAQGTLRITQPTTVTATVLGNGVAIGQDTIRVLPPN